MLAVALLWSISANFDKIGSRESSPIFYSALLDILLGLSLLAILMFTRRDFKRSMPSANIAPWLFLLGLLFAISTVAQFTSFTLANLSYVVAINYLNPLFSVLYGTLLLKEQSGKWRLTGAVIMILGVVLVAL